MTKSKIPKNLKTYFSFFKSNSGFSLVEALLAIAIFALVVTTLSGALIYGQQSTALAGSRSRASFLAEEGLEAVRNIRDENFANLTDGIHGLAIVDNKWQFSGSQDVTDSFTRQIEIVTINANTKKITAKVSWQQDLVRTGQIILETYLTNWRQAAPPLGWANPIQVASLNLPGNQAGTKIQVQGNYVYLVKAGSPDFYIINISNLAVPQIVGSLNLSGTANNLAVWQNYAYIASTDNNQELQIIDISNPASPRLVGTYNASGTGDALGVYLVNSTVYLTRISGNYNEFLLINVSQPNSPTLLGSLNTGSTAPEVVVLGNYAYLATYSNTQELQVINISNPQLPGLVGSANLPGAANALTICGFNTTIAIGRANGSIYLVNVASPANPTILGNYNAVSSVNDLSLGNNNKWLFVASDDNAAEFKLLDISNPATPTLVGSLNLSADLNGIAYSPEKDRAFAVSDAAGAELMVIGPSP